jgi:hypothetical protein
MCEVSHLQAILSDERRSAILQVNISHPVPFILRLAKTGNPDHLRSKFWSRRHSTCRPLNALEKSLNPGREDVIDGPPSESGQCLGEAVALGRESRLRATPSPDFQSSTKPRPRSSVDETQSRIGRRCLVAIQILRRKRWCLVDTVPIPSPHSGQGG